MKKTIIFGLLIIGILLVNGCGQQTQSQTRTEYVCPDGNIVSDLSYCEEECKDEMQQTSIRCSITNPCKIQFETRYDVDRTYHQECRDEYCVNIITCK